MLFNSLQYAIFLPLFFFIYWFIQDRYRNLLILIASYIFYMCWDMKYGFLILGISLVAYCTARIIGKYEKKKFILTCGICIILCILAYFKYFNFFLRNIYQVCDVLSISIKHRFFDIVLPVGISFFSFQAIAYMIDCYRGDVKAERNIIDFLAYISFFPQLVAGPIERTRNLMPQIKREKIFDYTQSTSGMKIMMVGFFKKLVVADVFSIYVDQVFGEIISYNGFALLLAAFFFTLQIYCDFSGYSDIAIGSAKILGIDLMENFRNPYLSESIREFWSRWHISLSTWFKDYVYIPLGGNRKGKLRKNLNTIITFVISGLWHGADWSYMVWGGYHGLGQILENTAFSRIGEQKNKPFFRVIRNTFVFVFCMFGWVFFRAANIKDAMYCLAHCLDGILNPSAYIKDGITALGIGGLSALHITISLIILFAIEIISYRCGLIKWISKRRMITRYLLYVVLLLIIIFFQASESATFVYFQF